MKQSEIDKLVDDIQMYLNRVREHGDMAEGDHRTNAETGIFIPSESKKRMERYLTYSRYACYAVEALTIALVTSVIMWPFSSLAQTAMFVVGTLLFGLFTVTMLLGTQARIRLLLRIETNTRRIAAGKARIADALEKMQFE